MSTADACTPPGTVVKYTGPLLLGYEWNWALYGAFCVQVYMYSEAGRTDSKITQVVVYSLLCLETAQICMSTHDSWHELVYSWGIPSGLEELYLTWLDLPIFTGMTSCIAQLFYAWRIYVLSGSKIVTGLIGALALMQLGGALGEGIRSKLLGEVSTLQTATHASSVVWLAGSAACDIIIALGMAYCLQQNKVGFSRVDTVLSKLVRLVIETGAATAVGACIELAMFMAYADTGYYSAPALVLSKLYSNSLMVLLNNHIAYHRQGESEATTDVSARLARDIFQGPGAIQVSINRGGEYTENVSMVELDGVKQQTESVGKHDLQFE